jgi:hypothetical protein
LSELNSTGPNAAANWTPLSKKEEGDSSGKILGVIDCENCTATNVVGSIACDSCGTQLSTEPEVQESIDKIHQAFTEAAGIGWVKRKSGGHSKAALDRKAAKKYRGKTIKEGYKSAEDKFVNNALWQATMTSNGHTQESIREIDILALTEGKDPTEYRWSKEYREEKFKDSYVLKSNRATGSGTVAIKDDPKFQELRSSRPGVDPHAKSGKRHKGEEEKGSKGSSKGAPGKAGGDSSASKKPQWGDQNYDYHW